jgi:hypothetical protein
MEQQEKPVDYIGDGVYVEYDGYGIWLKANHHIMATDKIYLEPGVLEGLNRFARHCGMVKGK